MIRYRDYLFDHNLIELYYPIDRREIIRVCPFGQSKILKTFLPNKLNTLFDFEGFMKTHPELVVCHLGQYIFKDDDAIKLLLEEHKHPFNAKYLGVHDFHIEGNTLHVTCINGVCVTTYLRYPIGGLWRFICPRDRDGNIDGDITEDLLGCRYPISHNQNQLESYLNILKDYWKSPYQHDSLICYLRIP